MEIEVICVKKRSHVRLHTEANGYEWCGVPTYRPSRILGVEQAVT